MIIVAQVLAVAPRVAMAVLGLRRRVGGGLAYDASIGLRYDADGYAGG